MLPGWPWGCRSGCSAGSLSLGCHPGLGRPSDRFSKLARLQRKTPVGRCERDVCYISTGCDPGSEQSSPWSLPCARGWGPVLGRLRVHPGGRLAPGAAAGTWGAVLVLTCEVERAVAERGSEFSLKTSSCPRSLWRVSCPVGLLSSALSRQEKHCSGWWWTTVAVPASLREPTRQLPCWHFRTRRPGLSAFTLVTQPSSCPCGLGSVRNLLLEPHSL